MRANGICVRTAFACVVWADIGVRLYMASETEAHIYIKNAFIASVPVFSIARSSPLLDTRPND